MIADYTTYLQISAVSTFLYFIVIQYVTPLLCELLLPKSKNLLPKGDKLMIANSFVSGINGVFATAVALYILLMDNLHEDIFWSNNHHVQVLASIQSGYFIADAIAAILTPGYPGRNTFLAHHACCLLALFVITTWKVFAFHMCIRTLNEFSAPFFNGRYVLAKLDMKETRLYVINGTLFMITFFLGRIAVMPIYYYAIVSASYGEGYERLHSGLVVAFYGVGVFIDTLNVYWFHLVVKGFFKYVSKSSPHKKE
ncbi:TLC domain-containing protein 4-B-like [Styela clava]